MTLSEWTSGNQARQVFWRQLALLDHEIARALVLDRPSVHLHVRGDRDVLHVLQDPERGSMEGGDVHALEPEIGRVPDVESRAPPAKKATADHSHIAPKNERESVRTLAGADEDLIPIDDEASALAFLATDEMQCALFDEPILTSPFDPIAANGDIVSLAIRANPGAAGIVNPVVGNQDPFGRAATADAGPPISHHSRTAGSPDLVVQNLDANPAVGSDAGAKSSTHTVAADTHVANALVGSELCEIRKSFDADLRDVGDTIPLDNGATRGRASQHHPVSDRPSTQDVRIGVFPGHSWAGVARVAADIFDVIVSDLPFPTVANQNSCGEKMNDFERFALQPENGHFYRDGRSKDGLPHARSFDFETVRKSLVDHDGDIVVAMRTDA